MCPAEIRSSKRYITFCPIEIKINTSMCDININKILFLKLPEVPGTTALNSLYSPTISSYTLYTLPHLLLD